MAFSGLFSLAVPRTLLHSSTRMPCDCTETIETIITADRKYVRTCRWIYLGVLLVSIVLTLFLARYIAGNSNLTSLLGLLPNGLALPLVPKHLQRSRALAVMEGLRQQCTNHDPQSPPCKRIAEAVDAILKNIGAV